jgi:large repetitive protein
MKTTIKKSLHSLAALMLLPASLFAATIAGTVTTGATGGAAGTPIADAKVVLIATAGGGGGAATRLDSTATDSAGKYTFTLDTTGFRQIQVIATGYNTGTGTVNAASDTGNYTVNVNLLSSAPGKLEGKVSSDSVAGTPIVGALVIVRRSAGGTFTPESTLTTSEGKYAFDSVPGNTGYTVAVSAAGFTSVTRNNVTIAGGLTSTQNFLLVPPPAPGSISGKVVKASDSSALAGARVILSRSGGGGGGGFTPDTALTNAQGAFAFDSVPANTNYTLTVSLSGYASSTRNTITVTAGQTNTQTIALAPPPAPGSISGKVVKVSDSSALADVRVILSRFGGGGGSFAADTAMTNAQGAFAFDSVPANTNYTLTVSLTGYETVTRSAVTVAAGQASTQNFALAPPPGPGSVSGKITKASDSGAVAGARVILSRTGGGGGGLTADTVLANAAGEYAFDSVANQNNYVLTVSAAGFSTTVSNNVSVAGGLKTTVNIALDALAEGDTTGTIKGIARNAANDAAIPGARVILTRVTGGGGGGGTPIDTVVADANGAFAFPDLVAGNYRLNLTATGFQSSQSGTLALAAGGTFLANVDLTTAVSILSSGRGYAAGKRFWNGGRLVVELDASKRARSLAVFGTDGKLKHRIAVAPGSSRVTLPADVTPGSRALLRVEY